MLTFRVSSRALRPFLFLLLFCAAGATGALGQGTVVFANHVPAAVISRVFLPLPSSPGLVQIGNGTADYPPGTTDWTGWTPVSGAGFSAQLFAAAGANVPVDSLAPALPVTSFHTGAGAGFVYSVTATLPGVPDSFLGTVTFQMRVWDNRSGSVTDWATALAQPAGTELVGVSAPFNLTGVFPPPIGPTPMYLAGLQSFNLTYIPEPSPFGLVGLGGVLLWVSWRRGSAQR
jgi:hypothetical protein